MSLPRFVCLTRCNATLASCIWQCGVVHDENLHFDMLLRVSQCDGHDRYSSHLSSPSFFFSHSGTRSASRNRCASTLFFFFFPAFEPSTHSFVWQFHRTESYFFFLLLLLYARLLFVRLFFFFFAFLRYVISAKCRELVLTFCFVLFCFQVFPPPPRFVDSRKTTPS